MQQFLFNKKTFLQIESDKSLRIELDSGRNIL